MIAERLVQFTRALRRAGLAAGPDRALAAVAALAAVGIERRDDVHAALAAVMLDRHDQQPIFDAVFDAFWHAARHPMLPLPGSRFERAKQQRLAGAVATTALPAGLEADAARGAGSLSHSSRERLEQADFDSMTAEEFALAKRLAERLPPPVQPVRRRRHERAHNGGRIDLRATMQHMQRQPHLLLPAWTQPRREWPPLVVLIDVSGSMERYARLFLHYTHALMRRHPRLHAFTFGTRLTNITRSLRMRDPDDALARVASQVMDWSGGTRIATTLAEFNHRWARRVLGANAAVLLVSDGLDHDQGGALGHAAAQLRRLAHEVVWLNPLLRFARFEPKAAGVRALLPHVDHFLPVHNLASLADLGRALTGVSRARRPRRGSATTANRPGR